jgi:hypothetical protein
MVVHPFSSNLLSRWASCPFVSRMLNCLFFILMFLLSFLAAKCLVRDDRKNNQWDFWDLWDSIPQSHGFDPIFTG